VLTSSPRIDARRAPHAAEGPEALRVDDPAPAAAGGRGRLVQAAAAARGALGRLPRAWRRPALSRLKSLGLESFGAGEGAAILDALAARAAGDPGSAASRLRTAAPPGGGAPLARYLLAASLLEADDLPAAASVLEEAGASLRRLPGPLAATARAIREAAAGRPEEAASALDRALRRAPSLAEARWLRARLSRAVCPLYDRERIEADLLAALRANPCCAACALDHAETAAFTGRPDQAARLLGRDAGCSPGGLDAARDRALALALAAAGRTEEALEAAARCEARDVGALRAGLAPTFLLAGDHAHLAEAYDSEGDARLPPRISAEQHLHMGLGLLWTGRPSEAAAQLARAEEHLRPPEGSGGSPPSWLLLVRALRIRAYLTAGRFEEAARAAEEFRAEGGGILEGRLGHAAALAELAFRGPDRVLERRGRLTTTPQKFWRYLALAEAALARGRPEEALAHVRLALLSVNTQVTVCPGISTEPELLALQAKALLAAGRHVEAARAAERLAALGARALFAPDIVVGGLILLGRAREGQGDAAGARRAYEEVVARWGDGEGVPAVEEARRRMQNPAGLPASAGPTPAAFSGAGRTPDPDRNSEEEQG
jgi:tetratricopeptide (TPR) repeat protein